MEFLYYDLIMDAMRLYVHYPSAGISLVYSVYQLVHDV
jgi:hypothetical protein